MTKHPYYYFYKREEIIEKAICKVVDKILLFINDLGELKWNQSKNITK